MAKFSHTYFRTELVRFWDMCGNRNSTITELEIARRAIHWLYLNCDGDISVMATELEIADINYLRRLPFFEAMSH